MKKQIIILAGILMLCKAEIRAQITLEHVFDSTHVGIFYCTDIGNGDFKYVFLNEYLNSFSLYNLDMSPYLTDILIPDINDSLIQGFKPIYITKTLFDCDSNNIEYVFQTQYDVKHSFRVFRTNGTLLFKVDSANGPYGLGSYGGSHDVRPIINTHNGTKLFLQKFNNNGAPQVLVYSLCGSLPEYAYDFSNQEFFVKIFPNPASHQLNFDIIFPNNREEFQLIILDNNSKEQKRENISLQQNKYSLDVSQYSSGIYIFSLVSKNKVYQTGKFILTK